MPRLPIHDDIDDELRRKGYRRLGEDLLCNRCDHKRRVRWQVSPAVISDLRRFFGVNAEAELYQSVMDYARVCMKNHDARCNKGRRRA